MNTIESLLNLRLDKNVGQTERIISTLAGTLMMLHGFRKGKRFSEIPVGSFLLFRGLTGYCPVKERLSGNHMVAEHHKINIKTSVIVDKPRNEVYTFWRALENLPLFMKHLDSVTVLDDKTSLWKANIPGGFGTIEWKSEIVHDAINERIGWQSLPGSQIENAGNVQFRDAGNNQTELFAVISYEAPGGVIGEGVGKILNPIFEKMVKADMESFKEYMETERVTV
jgi:uncharacterized membrane protein